MLRHVRNPSTPSPAEVWQNLRAHWAKLPEQKECWHPANLTSQGTLTQVEQHKPSSRDIKLDLSMARSHETDIILEWWGECNIPRWFLKNAHWDAHNNSDGTIDLGYYTKDPDGNYHAIDFDFNSLTWGTIYHRSNGKYHLTIPTPIELGLHIYNEERAIPWSDWGEIDSTKDQSDMPDEHSDKEEPPQSPPTPTQGNTDKETELQKIAKAIPTTTNLQPGNIWSNIFMATTTQTTTQTAAQPSSSTTQTFTSSAGKTMTGGAGPLGGGGGQGTTNPLHTPFGPPGGGGSGGSRGNPGGGGNPRGNLGGGSGGNPGQPSNKLAGQQPQIFEGDRCKSEVFIQEWNIYQGLNWATPHIINPFSWALLFLSFIKGDKVQEWSQEQLQWAVEYVDQAPGNNNHEYLWTMIANSFYRAFTNITQEVDAQTNIKDLKMKGDQGLDNYISTFECLAHLRGYNLNDQAVIDMFIEGLPTSLAINIAKFNDPNTYLNWKRGAVQHHTKYMWIKSKFHNKGQNKPHPTQDQWKKAFLKKGDDAMDTTPGQVKAHATNMCPPFNDDEREKLQKEGRYFQCKKQGHLSHDCPDKPSQARGNLGEEEDSEDKTIKATPSKPTNPFLVKKKTMAQDIIRLITNTQGWCQGHHHSGGVHETGFLKCSNLMVWGRALREICCQSVYNMCLRSMKIPASFRTSHAMTDKRILVDSGATNNFINPWLITWLGLGTRNLEWPRKIWNIDGTNNQAGMLTKDMDLSIHTGKKEETMRFLVTSLGNEDLILGYPWLTTFEPWVNWTNGVMDTCYLPVVIHSLDWKTLKIQPTIVAVTTDKSPPISTIQRIQIHEELAPESNTWANISTELAQKAGQYTQKVEIPGHYKQFAQVFNKEASHQLPLHQPWDHAINLKKDAPASLNCKIYPLTIAEKRALQKWLDEELQKGYITESKSPYASLFFFIKKKDGKLWPVQDYQKLNEHMIRNTYPLPLIPNLIQQIEDAWVFTKFNVQWGYNNIRIKDGDQWKAAFKTCFGTFQPKVMYFGMSNSLPTFQMFMNMILAATQDKHCMLDTKILDYMDDILIASKGSTMIQEHWNTVKDVLQVLQDYNLFLKLEKWVWESPHMDYLGLILEKGVTCMDPVKIAGIQDWPTPTTVKQVWSFLGFCNFYQAFIWGFSHLAKPLNNLTKKDTPWMWESEQQTAFDMLREHIISEPVLIQPDLSKPFEIEVDSLGFAWGAILLQRGTDNKKHLIAFYSQTLTDAKQNYSIKDLEFSAIIYALLHWHPFLTGSPHDIIIHTDHTNLQAWTQPQKISQRVAKLVQALEEFPIKLKHISGKSNGHADALSWWADYDQGDKDNENIIVLPKHIFIWALQTLPLQDERTLKPWVNTHNLIKIQGRWWKNNWEVVTASPLEQWEIISKYHDPPALGHPGISWTTHLISQHLWWPKLTDEVKQYVKGCAACQQNKVNTQGKKAPLLPIFPVADTLPFSTIALDFIVKLPKSHGHDSILTITNQGCTKMAIFLPCNETIDAEGATQLYFCHVFPRFGVPSKVITDQEPWFTSQFMTELCAQLCIEQNMSTAYHPWMDGQSEWTNQWLEQYLWFWVNHHWDNWYQFLPMAEFTHNSWCNETTKTTLYQTLMGYNPAADWRPWNTTVPAPVTCLEQWKLARETAYTQMRRVQEWWAQAKREGRQFQQGDLVWLEGHNLKTDRPSVKLATKRYRLFSVAQELSPVTYQLTLPEQWKIHPVFHVDLLTPYKETVFHCPNYTRPPLDLVNNKEEYKVEQVLDLRVRGCNCKVQYLVKWVRYPDSNNQWIDADQMRANEAIAELKKRRLNAQTHIRHTKMGNLLIDFPLMSSPTPSTIENVICSGASSPHEYSLAHHHGPWAGPPAVPWPHSAPWLRWLSLCPKAPHQWIGP